MINLNYLYYSAFNSNFSISVIIFNFIDFFVIISQLIKGRKIHINTITIKINCYFFLLFNFILIPKF